MTSPNLTLCLVRILTDSMPEASAWIRNMWVTCCDSNITQWHCAMAICASVRLLARPRQVVMPMKAIIGKHVYRPACRIEIADLWLHAKAGWWLPVSKVSKSRWTIFAGLTCARIKGTLQLHFICTLQAHFICMFLSWSLRMKKLASHTSRVVPSEVWLAAWAMRYKPGTQYVVSNAILNCVLVLKEPSFRKPRQFNASQCFSLECTLYNKIDSQTCAVSATTHLTCTSLLSYKQQVLVNDGAPLLLDGTESEIRIEKEMRIVAELSAPLWSHCLQTTPRVRLTGQIQFAYPLTLCAGQQHHCPRAIQLREIVFIRHRKERKMIIGLLGRQDLHAEIPKKPADQSRISSTVDRTRLDKIVQNMTFATEL